MADRKVSILLPSAYRARQLRRALDMLLDSTNHPLEVCVSTVADDISSLSVIMDYRLTLYMRSVNEYQRGAVYAWNRLAEIASGDVLVLWADDLVPEYGWLEKALTHLDMLGDGLIGLNDLHSDGNIYAAHWLTTRHYLLAHCGGVMYPPCYKSWWADREVTDKAISLGRYIWAQDAIVEHNNYTFGASKIDDTYRAAMQNYDADEALYNARKAQGFPIDYEAVMS